MNNSRYNRSVPAWPAFPASPAIGPAFGVVTLYDSISWSDLDGCGAQEDRVGACRFHQQHGIAAEA